MERFPSSRCASAIQIVRPCASKAEQAAPTSSGFTEIVGDDSPLLVSLTLESLLKGFSHYVQSVLPGGIAVAMSVYLVFDFAYHCSAVRDDIYSFCLMPRFSGETFGLGR